MAGEREPGGGLRWQQPLCVASAPHSVPLEMPRRGLCHSLGFPGEARLLATPMGAPHGSGERGGLCQVQVLGEVTSGSRLWVLGPTMPLMPYQRFPQLAPCTVL